jgi:hypothetical protein
VNVRSQEYKVYLDVTGENRFVLGSQGKPGYTVITPQVMMIVYEWYPNTAMWRVSKSAMSGVNQRGESAHHVWVLGQPDKPIWVVALEHKFHPVHNKIGARR